MPRQPAMLHKADFHITRTDQSTTSGRIFGLMPHPEAFNHWTNHPDWTRMKALMKRQGQSIKPELTVATKIFKNAVDYVHGTLP
jgi:phosphoribosylformylglycinamidine synthase